MSETPVILHYPDFRGDHAADALKVLMLPPTTTIEELREIASRYTQGGNAWIEIGHVERIPGGA